MVQKYGFLTTMGTKNKTKINRQDANDIPDFAVAICEYVYVLTDKYNTYLSCKENSEKRSS